MYRDPADRVALITGLAAGGFALAFAAISYVNRKLALRAQ